MIDRFKDIPKLSGKDISLSICYDGPIFVRIDGIAVGVIGCDQKPNTEEMGYRASGPGYSVKRFDEMDDAIDYIINLYLESGLILEYGNHNLKK